MNNRIVFIDSHINNYQSLIAQLPKGTKVILLDAERDGIEQILAALQGKTNLDAIDILSHGSPGIITLGSSILSNSNLYDYARQLAQIGRYLKDGGDILLYGCEVAKGETGQTFIEQLATLTGADVAASTNLTGPATLGGDWLLEAQIGKIQTNTMQFFYDDVLATITGTTGNDTLTGTSGDDELTGGEGDDTLDGGSGNDVAVFSGNQAGYEFSLNAGGKITVKDINPADGDDGTDTLSAIQIARFADRDVKIWGAGGEFQVNTYTTNDQHYPNVIGLPDGGFVVVWESLHQDGSGIGIYAQRYDANGEALGSEFRVNTTTYSHQDSISVAKLTDGGFVVSWMSDAQDGSGNGIYGQRYDANGVVQGTEFQINTYTLMNQNHPSVAALSNGGFVVCWTSYNQDSANTYGVYAQRYDANGAKQGGEFRVNTTTVDHQYYPNITALTNGGFVVSWMSNLQDGSYAGVYAQRYDANGTEQGDEFRVNTTTESNQSFPTITALTNGGFVVSWMSKDGNDVDVYGWGVYAQRYDANGTKQGDEFRVNTYVTSDQKDPVIAALSDGGFVVSWSSDSQDGSYSGVYAQRYDANGVAQGSELLVNTYTTSHQYYPNIAALADGGFVVSWASDGQDGSGYGIYAQRYDANGNPVQIIIGLSPLGSPTAILSNGTEDNAYIVTAADLLAGFSAGGNPLAVANLSADHGTVSNNGNGTFTITPDGNYNGLVTLNYAVVNTNSGDSIAAMQSFTLAAVNDAPSFVAGDNQVVSEDAGAKTIPGWASSLTTGPANEAGQALSFMVENDNAALFAVAPSIDANGALSYTPAANAHGTAQVTVKIKDSGGTANDGIDTSAAQSFTITIDAVNDNPTDISLSNDHILENSAIGTAVGTLVTTDVDNDAGFSYQLISGTGDSDNTSFTIANDKLLLNTATDFETKDSYSIRIQTTDAGGLAYEEAFTIHIDNVNDAPSADPDNAPFATEAGGVNNGTAGSNLIVAAASGVLSNDSNGGDLSDPLQVKEVSFYDGTDTHTANAGIALPGLYGTLTLNADGSYSYIVDNDHAAVQGLRTSSDTLTETFQYTMRDQNGTGLASASTLTVTIAGANDAPVAHADGGNAREAGVVAGQNATGNVLLNDADTDNGDSKTVANDGAYVGDYGTLTLNADGSYNYVVDNTHPLVDALNVGDSLQDTFDCTVVDAQGATSTAQLTITIAGGNDAPVAGTDTVATDQDSVIDIDVLTNDSDVDSSSLTVSLPGNTSTGGAAIAVNPDQTVQYNPGDAFDSLALGDHTSDSFDYTVHDDHPIEPGSSNGTVNLNIAGLNDAPQAQADTALTTENAVVTIDVLQNDDDADNNDSKTLVSVNVVNPANQGGSASIDGNQLVWNPNLDFDHLKDGESTQVTLQYVMQDNHNAASAASVTITVQGSNDAPQGALIGSLANGQEDQSYWIDEAVLLAGFSDAENDTLTVQNPVVNHGTLSAGVGGWTFTPDSNYHGAVTLTYTVGDGKGGVTDTVTRGFNLTSVNDDPIATADTLTTDEDQATTLDVVVNDDDIDGDALNVFAVTQGAHGAVAFAGGVVTYTPHQNYQGTDSFSYMVSDGQGGADTETVQVTVNSINDAPYVSAALDAQSAMALDSFTYTLPTNTFNDVDGDNLSFSAITPGWLSFDPNTQTFSGTPTNTGAGENIVQVTATDPSGETVTTGFIINVTQNLNGISSAVENTVPSPAGGTTGDGNGDGILDSQQSNVASVPIPNSTVWATFGAGTDVVVTNMQNQPLLNTPQKMDAPYGAFSFNLENLTPGETVPMSLYLTGNWSNTKGKEWTNSETGDVINGYWKQMPNQNWKNIATAMVLEGGKLRIDFTLTDGDWTDKDGLVNGTIVDPGVIGLYNNAPVANNDDVGSVDEDGVLGFTLQGILGNDTDLDDESLIPTLVAGPAHGTITELADGSFSYTPNTNFHGADSFTYQVNDGTEDSNIATVNIMVNSVNDIPTGSTTGTLADGIEDTVYSVLAATLLQGFSDVDTEDTLSVISINSVNGTFAATANGWDFTPVEDHNGLATFNYQVSDGAGGIVDVTRTLNLTPVNDIPFGSAAGELAHDQEDTPYTILQSDLLSGYSDVDGDVLSVIGLTINHGTLSAFNSSTSSWTFTPDKDFNGAVNLSYGITDGNGGSVSDIDRSFIVDPVNDVPKAGDDAGTVFEDASVTVGFDLFLANDIDVDGSDQTIVGIDATGTKCSVSIDLHNRTITYSADADVFDLLTTGNTAMDSFKYILKGSSGETTSAMVEISVLGVSDGNLNMLGTVQADTLDGTAGEDRIKGNNGNDLLNGNEGADDLFGENGDDTLNGGNSIDNLFGGNGNDILNGGNGNDWLAGERGNDTLTGGLGNDVFLFAQGGGIDIITDFTNGVDLIQIAADTGITTFSQLKITGGIDGNGIAYSTIAMGNGGQVTLTGVPITQLDTADFIFPS